MMTKGIEDGMGQHQLAIGGTYWFDDNSCCMITDITDAFIYYQLIPDDGIVRASRSEVDFRRGMTNSLIPPAAVPEAKPEPPANPLSPQEERFEHVLMLLHNAQHGNIFSSDDLNVSNCPQCAELRAWPPAAPKVVDSKEEQFGIGPGTVKQCEHLDGERYCCRLRDGHEGEHVHWTADDVAKLRISKVEGQDVEQELPELPDFQGATESIFIALQRHRSFIVEERNRLLAALRENRTAKSVTIIPLTQVYYLVNL